jgi:methyl-accepting chemotaxis protein
MTTTAAKFAARVNKLREDVDVLVGDVHELDDDAVTDTEAVAGKVRKAQALVSHLRATIADVDTTSKKLREAIEEWEQSADELDGVSQDLASAVEQLENIVVE